VALREHGRAYQTLSKNLEFLVWNTHQHGLCAHLQLLNCLAARLDVRSYVWQRNRRAVQAGKIQLAAHPGEPFWRKAKCICGEDSVANLVIGSIGVEMWIADE
jgi:hypothetical protein